jgi:hypothetical protein
MDVFFCKSLFLASDINILSSTKDKEIFCVFRLLPNRAPHTPRTTVTSTDSYHAYKELAHMPFHFVLHIIIRALDTKPAGLMSVILQFLKLLRADPTKFQYILHLTVFYIYEPYAHFIETFYSSSEMVMYRKS